MTQQILENREAQAEAVRLIDKFETMEAMTVMLIDLLSLTSEDQYSTIKADKRWLSVAKTDLAKGFKALKRSILLANPDLKEPT